MNREVVQLITPGTLLEPEGDAANHLMSIVPGPEENLGIAWLELSTSKFQVTMITEDQLDEHIERVSPSEVLLSEKTNQLLKGGDMGTTQHIPSSVKGLISSLVIKECQITSIPGEWLKETAEPSETYKSILTSLSKDGYSSLESQASLSILNYIRHTQRSLVPFLRPPLHYSHTNHVTIDARTRRSLELVTPLLANTRAQTLLGCIDKTVTAGGKRLIRERLSAPLTNVNDINRRLNVVEYFKNRQWESDWLVTALKSICDLERFIQKVATGRASLEDLFLIGNTLSTTHDIIQYLKEDLSKESDLQEELRGLQEFPKLTKKLNSAICKKNFTIKKGYSMEADRLQKQLKENETQVDLLANNMKERFNLSKLLVVQHKQFYRILETTKTQGKHIDRRSLRSVEETQSAERFSNPELEKLNLEHLRLTTEYGLIETRIQSELLDKVRENTSDLLEAAQGLASLDVSLSLANVARNKNYCKPVLTNEGSVFNIINGYHPVLSSAVKAQVIPNDCKMEEHKTWIITGPNMGGKSTFLRQNALIVILAQMGSFVPANSAEISVTDKVFARVGASDNLTKGQSTFYTEMIETAHILSTATPASFVILDEIGRGTATSEGVAIAQSVIEYIHKAIGCRTLLATHFHELTETLSNRYDEIGSYYTVAQPWSNGEIILTYKIEMGSTDSSYALQTARLAGLPEPVLERAQNLMSVRKEEMEPVNKE
ncbi:PREDICTED: uncharacterized protein LOC100634951 [Amphimedon queenslandica]|nr:PREDICTED: uncharacterized protein LOC100634951 [Amphimedon queenslandica]|eukprot:XP_003389234.2 PREDICTED: uncharacterized protein LOC100634951 [Amphimedon queenslandica]